MTPIQTRYKGYHFRSRLEARWAVYFDTIGCEWEYEPDGFHLPDGSLYLPDFWLKTVKMWAEVKPDWPTDDEVSKAKMLAAETGRSVLFLDGTPRDTNYWAVYRDDSDDFNQGFPWVDFFLNNWYFDEKRFYCSTPCDFGPNRPDQEAFAPDELTCEAIDAARSARFEHGESGRT